MSTLSSSPSLSIRPATTDDQDVLAGFARRTFYEAFGQVVAPDSMTAYLAETFAPEQVGREIADSQTVFLLATVEGALRGYAKLHFGEPLPQVQGDAPVKLWRLYTLASEQSRGVGAALVAEAARLAQSRGGRTLWLTVNQGNARAIAFYERNGFVRTAEALFQLGDETHHDWVMEKSL